MKKKRGVVTDGSLSKEIITARAHILLGPTQPPWSQRSGTLSKLRGTRRFAGTKALTSAVTGFKYKWHNEEDGLALGLYIQLRFVQRSTSQHMQHALFYKNIYVGNLLCIYCSGTWGPRGNIYKHLKPPNSHFYNHSVCALLHKYVNEFITTPRIS